GPTTTAPGASILVNDTTKNQGGGTTVPTTTRFYLSTDSVLSASDVLLGERTVPALGAGASNQIGTTLTIPASTVSGSYFVIAQADATLLVAETLENNNTRAGSTMTIGPDLVLTALTIPGTAAAGASITVSDTTKNQGGVSAPTSNTAFYLSVNATFDA